MIVGCDRVAANGDVANKIGTYALALAARAHGVPFYVVGPRSTLDAATASGADIDDRAARRRGAARGADCGVHAVWNPAFDVTPAAARHRADHRRRRAARALRGGDRPRVDGEPVAA